MKKEYIFKGIALGVVSAVAFGAFAAPKKMVQIFRNGEVIQEYAVSDIDYIEVNDVSELEGSAYEYAVKSKNYSGSGEFVDGFCFKNSWDEGMTFNYSISPVNCFQQLGNNMNIELYVGSKQLYDGKPFDVAETDLPFSFKLQYVDYSKGSLVDVVIDNNNRKGASGTITVTRNVNGEYDAEFDISMLSGDVTVKGYYAGELKKRNAIYTTGEGILGEIKSATLDLSGDTCVMYLSAEEGEAGPDNYDIKGEVSKEEWRYGKFMAFSGMGSKVTWLDGMVIDSTSSETTGFFGGNWRVMNPTVTSDGSKVAECSVMLFGPETRYVYYWGFVKVIE